MLVAVILERVELVGDFQDDIAPAAAVSAVWAAARHIFLAPKAERAGSAVAGFDKDLDAISEHTLPPA